MAPPKDRSKMQGLLQRGRTLKQPSLGDQIPQLKTLQKAATLTLDAFSSLINSYNNDPSKQSSDESKLGFDPSKLLLDTSLKEQYAGLLATFQQSTHPNTDDIKRKLEINEQNFLGQLQTILKSKLQSEELKALSENLLSSFLSNTPIIIENVSFLPPENFLDFVKQISVLDKILTTKDKALRSDPTELKKFQELKDFKEVQELQKSQKIGRKNEILKLKALLQAQNITERKTVLEQFEKLNASMQLKEEQELKELKALQQFERLSRQEKLKALNKDPIVKEALFKEIEKENQFSSKYTAILKANRRFIVLQSSTVESTNTRAVSAALVDRYSKLQSAILAPTVSSKNLTPFLGLDLPRCIPESERKESYEKLMAEINKNLAIVKGSNSVSSIGNVMVGIHAQRLSSTIREEENNFLKKIQKMFEQEPLNQLKVPLDDISLLDWFSSGKNNIIINGKEIAASNNFQDFLVKIEPLLTKDQLSGLQKQYLSFFEKFNNQLNQINRRISKMVSIIEEMSNIKGQLSGIDRGQTLIPSSPTQSKEETTFPYQSAESFIYRPGERTSISSQTSSMGSSGSSPDMGSSGSSASEIDSSGSRVSVQTSSMGSSGSSPDIGSSGSSASEIGSVGNSNSSLPQPPNVPIDQEQARLIEERINRINTAIAEEKKELLLDKIEVELPWLDLNMVKTLLPTFLSEESIKIQDITIPPQKEFLDFLKVSVYLANIFKSTSSDEDKRFNLHELEWHLNNDNPEEKQEFFKQRIQESTHKELIKFVKLQERSLDKELTATTLEKTIEELSLPPTERSKITATPKATTDYKKAAMEDIQQEQKELLLEQIATKLSSLEKPFNFNDIMGLLSNFLSQKPITLYNVTFPVEPDLLNFLKVVSLLGDTFKNSDNENIQGNLKQLEKDLRDADKKEEFFTAVAEKASYKEVAKMVEEQAKTLEQDKKDMSGMKDDAMKKEWKGGRKAF